MAGVDGGWTALRRLVAGAAYEAKTLLAARPALAVPLARLRGHGEVVDERTDLVIEGFPRSGNTFAVAAFRLAQEPRAVRVAHHVHAPAQVLRAVALGVPALVLVREPEEAVVSLLVRDPERPPAALLRGYVRFHEPLLPHLDAIVVATFEEAVGDLGRAIRRVNERFGTRFRPFEHTEANVERVLAEIEADERRRRAGLELERAIPRPSELRERLKDEARTAYRGTALALRRRAAQLYEAFAARA